MTVPPEQPDLIRSLSPRRPAYDLADRIEIRQLIDDWAIGRDTGDWDLLESVWHPDGHMVTTWSQSSAAVFIERSRKAWESGVMVFHTMGGGTMRIDGDRAVAETRVTIGQRAMLDDVLVDVACVGLFWDALERRDDGWGFVRRQPVYDADRISPVDPGVTLILERDLLESFPAGYRHLAYLQTKIGFNVSRSLHSTRDPEMARLRSAGRRWLAGEGASCLDYL